VSNVRHKCPNRLDTMEYMSFRDKMKSTDNGPVVDGTPKAYINSMKAVDRWDDGTEPSSWGEKHVLVIDSFTTMARSAYWWAKGLQGASGFAEGTPMKGVRPEQFYHTAQQALMNTISYVTADSFGANVIVIAHVKYLERDGVNKGYPVAVGNAISPEIPTYFPSVALATKSGTKRIIRTVSTNTIDLKNPRAFDMAADIDMDTGLAKFFATLHG
jgi:hypothetical protein